VKPEPAPEPGSTGRVVIDLGDDIGAAIIYAPADLDGAEIEIRPEGRPWAGQHSCVRARHLAAGVTHAALFGGLAQGGYEVRLRGADHDPPVSALSVIGGRLTFHHLQTPSWALTGGQSLAMK
jgi:hypothetical protein